jgi:hypothetical protein
MHDSFMIAVDGDDRKPHPRRDATIWTPEIARLPRAIGALTASCTEP